MEKIVGYYDYQDHEFAIASVEFYEKHGGCDADGLDAETEAALPEGFYQIAESYYEHDFETNEEAAAALEAAGFVRGSLD